MDSFTEVLLYVLLFGLLAVLRALQKWNRVPIHVFDSMKPLSTFQPIKRAKKKTHKIFRKSGVSDLDSWREPFIKGEESPRKDDAGSESILTVPIKLRPGIVDLESYNFERLRPENELLRPAPTPPNSPVSIHHGYPNPYGLDPSFNGFIVPEKQPPIERDKDFQRRRSYIKSQITDGEIMARIDGWDVCLIFVFGIEYHYCVKDQITQWDIPRPLVKKCQDWFLQLPKRKQRILGLDAPPLPLETTPKVQPTFQPLAYIDHDMVLF